MLKEILKYRLHYLPFLFIIMLLLLIRGKLILSYSIDIDGLEYYFVHLTQQLLDGKPIYANPEAYPYSINLYTPVYFYLYAGIIRLSHLDYNYDLHKILIAGRILNILLLFVQFIYLKKLINRFTPSLFIYLAVVTFYLLLISGHMFAVRPDGLKATLFIIFFYYLAAYSLGKNKLFSGMLCILSAVLAVFTKQDIALYIGGCFLVALFFSRTKEMLLLFLSFIFISLICVLLFYFQAGKYIFPNLVLFNMQSVTDYYRSYNVYFILLGMLRTLPLMFMCIYSYRKLKSRNEWNAAKFITICTLLFFPVSFISLLRPGATLNYTYQLSFFLVLQIPVFFNLYDGKPGIRKLTIWTTIYIAFLFLSNGLIHNYSYDKKQEAVYKHDYLDCLQTRDSINSVIKNDTVFFPNTKYSIFFNTKNVVLGHDMHLDRFINLYTPVYIKSKLSYIDTAPYDANFTNGRIRYIIIQNDSKSTGHVKEYYPNYHFYKQVGQFLIYSF